MSKLSRTITALAVVATLAVASQARADLSLGDLIFGTIPPNTSPAFIDTPIAIIFEDNNATKIIDNDGSEGVSDGDYVVGVIQFQSLTRAALPSPPTSIAAVGIDGSVDVDLQAGGVGTTINALVFGQIANFGLAGAGDFDVVAAGVGTVNVGGVDLPSFDIAGGEVIKIYLDQSPVTLQRTGTGAALTADLTNVLSGDLIATVGYTGEGSEFFHFDQETVLSFFLSLNFLTNTSGVEFLDNFPFGTEVYGSGNPATASFGIDAEGWTTQGDGDFALIVVPTPAALPAAIGLFALAATRRRRRAA